MKRTDNPQQGGIAYRTGLQQRQFEAAAQLYDEAFGRKIGVAVRSRRDRVALLEAGLMPDFAICANAGNELIGLAGFHEP